MKPIPPKGAAACAYLRVSTDDQAAEGKTSLADQRTAISLLAEKLGVVVGRWFEDPGASGASADRPGFDALRRFCETHPCPTSAPGYVLVMNDSRWGRFRDPDEATYWRVHFSRFGWRVQFAEGDETDDPLARGVLRAVHSATASAYRESIRANAKRGAIGAAKRGLWQNEAPLGYRRLATRPGQKSEMGRILEPGQRKADDEETRLTLGPESEQAVVQWMFKTYAAGLTSLGEMARELDRRCPTRQWSPQTVRAVLKNPAYLGDVVWCRRPHDVVERQHTPVRDRTEWVVVSNTHPPLVSRALFAEVQRRFHERAGVRRTATVGGYALSGLLTCAQCGKPYRGAGGPKGPPHDPDRYRFYRDSGGVGRRPVCNGRLGTLQRRWAEPRVVSEVAGVVQEPATVQAIREAVDAYLGGQRGSPEVALKRLALDKQRLEEQRTRVVSSVANGTFTDDEAAPVLSRIREDLEKVRSQTQGLRSALPRSGDIAQERDRLLAMAAEFKAMAETASGAELRDLLRPWLASATVDKVRGEIVLAIRRVPAELMLASYSPGRG